MQRYAALDIGSNTILMCIADVDNDGKYNIIRDEHAIARLGEKSDSTKMIIDDAITRGSNVLANYHDICQELKVDKIFAVATSALRDAKNQQFVLDKLSNALGSNIVTINGEEEAQLSFLGTIEDDSNSTVIDIGGGSTEIISGINDIISFRKSINIGVVRLTEKFLSIQPAPELAYEQTIEYINNNLAQFDKSIIQKKVYAVAGTPTTIAAVALNCVDYNKNLVHGYNLTQLKIKEIFELFKILSPVQIMENYHIHKLRSDVIVAGILLLMQIMKYFNLESVTVSNQGLRYGVLKNMIINK